MVNNTSQTKSTVTCFQCGSLLVFVSKEIVKPEGSRFTQVNTVYRCSNIECQEKKDKEKADRAVQQQKKTELAKIRLEQMQKKRELNQKLKANAA